MTQPNNEPTEPNLQSTLTEALRLLEEIRLARVKAEEHLGVAEASRNKADSEALFAFNAKKACEEHSTAIASLKGTVEADVNGIVANKQKSDELMAAINAGKAAIDADQKTINDRRKEVDQSALDIAKAAEVGVARLADITTAKDAAEPAAKEAKEILAATVQAGASTEESKKRAEKLATEAAALTTSIS